MFFYADRKFKMAATAGLKLTLVPMGKCSNAFLSCGGGHLEFSICIKKEKLCRGPSNDHSWAVWIQLSNGPLQTLRFLFRYEIQNGGYGRT
jgi:hypothetical protein